MEEVDLTPMTSYIDGSNMLKKYKRIILDISKIFLGLSLILGTFILGYHFLSSKFRTPDVDYGDSFHSLPEDSMDVIVLGSSHAQYSFIPASFYQDTGLYSYVLGSSYQPYKVSYQMLKEALKTQSPELVILEVYTGIIDDEESDLINDTRYILAQYQMTGEEKKATLDYIEDKDKALEYKNDFLINHNNWKTISNINNLLSNDKDVDEDMGYIPNYGVTLPSLNYYYSPNFEESVDGVDLKEEDIQALTDIIGLCRRNNTKLLLYMVPIGDFDEVNSTLLNKIWTWASENGVDYLDLINNDRWLDLRGNIHHDGYHAYIGGASYITNYLSSFIKAKFEFTSHVDNEMLNEIYRSKIYDYSFALLSSELNPNKFLCRYVNYPGAIAIRYKGSELTYDIKQQLDDLGIGDLIYGVSSFYGIIVNGDLINYSFKDEVTFKDANNIISVNDTGIYLNGQLIDDNDNLSLTIFKENYEDTYTKNITCKDGYAWQDGWTYGYQYESENEK